MVFYTGLRYLLSNLAVFLLVIFIIYTLVAISMEVLTCKLFLGCMAHVNNRGQDSWNIALCKITKVCTAFWLSSSLFLSQFFFSPSLCLFFHQVWKPVIGVMWLNNSVHLLILSTAFWRKHRRLSVSSLLLCNSWQ